MRKYRIDSIRFRLFMLVFFALLFLQVSLKGQSQQADQECFMILVGKKASIDGSVLLAHNNDLSGDEPSHLVKFPAQKYSDNDSITFPSGLKIPQASATYEWMALKILDGYAEGDAVAINEHGVAIAGGVALKHDWNSKAITADPLIKNGLSGGIRYVCLQRSKTARQCVKMLGDFYTEYGVTYPSGVGIADTNEIWYIESGGAYSWAAIRIPDSCYWPQANGYRIGFIDPDDTLNYYCSPGLQEFCIGQKLWNPVNGAFKFADAFGGGRVENDKKQFYDTRRIWRCIQILNPTLDLAPDLEKYPACLVPEAKISLNTCFNILRDRYQGTEFENSVDDSGVDGERPIASWNAVHTDVINLYPGTPVYSGAILWAGIGPPQVTTYVPFSFHTQMILPAYNETSAEMDEKSAFWVYYSLAQMAKNNEKLQKKIAKKQVKLEKEFMDEVDQMIYHSEDDPLNANGLHALSWDILSLYFANESLEQARKFVKKKK